ncbi:MAG: mechanosensitive ion channel family protein [Candidatus Gastranaerophilales bacterium]|nr:mechanosensitive ion channel family protein [Candidatus Gastranaerophilales bacterium]
MINKLFFLKKIKTYLIIVNLFLIISCNFAFSQNNNTEIYNQAPVVLDNKELFEIKTRAGSFTPELRAKIVSSRIKRLAEDKSFKTTSITVKNQDNYTDIISGTSTIISVTDNDARIEGVQREKLAKNYVEEIKTGIEDYREARSLKNILLGIVYTFIATIAIILAFNLFRLLFKKIIKILDSWKGTVIRPLKIQNYELLPIDRIIDILIWTIKILGIFTELGLIYLYFILILSFFVWTADFSNLLKYNLFSSLINIWNSIIDYLPNLLFITIVIIITYYLNKFIKFVFSEISKSRLRFSGFYKEWADTTSKIVRFLMFAIVLAIIFPYLPGAESDAFKGLSIFLGVLISLGSTTAVANIVAGIILTYTRAFKTGDRLKIADTTGDIIEKTLLVTRIRTIKYEIISIPNSLVLGSPIVNYSSSAEDPGLILHTTVSIGYSTPWRKVHELLINAALSTQNVLAKPIPFVLQTKLDDFYISYEVNAYTNKPSVMQNTYSELHKNIQDKFNEAGIEIMSPHFSALRDGNNIAIPQDYISENYNPPRFRINETDK